MSRTTLISRIVTAGVAMLAALLLAPATGQAVTITSETGPLTEITINPDLSCQVRYESETSYSFFPPADATEPRCRTYVARGSDVFGQFAPNDLIPTYQQPVSGDGSASNPFTIFTAACAGTAAECEEGSAPIVSTYVRYVEGEDFFRTDVNVSSNGLEETIGIYQFGDCYLQGTDEGYGYFDSSTGGTYCAENPDNVPVGRLIGFVPISPGSTWTEGQHNDYVRPQILLGGGAPLDNQCQCEIFQDNAVALAWTGLDVPAFGSAQRSFLTAFSPPGFPVEPPPQVTLESPPDGYSSEDNLVDFAGSAGSAGSDSPTVYVEIFEGSTIPENYPYTSFGADVVDGMWSFEDFYLAPGTYTARARQATDSGNEGFSDPVTFTIIDTTDLTLDPPTAENPVGTDHTVTATLTTNRDGGREERQIFFRVSGANEAEGWSDTNESGEATFTYTGTNAGVDTIRACADLDYSGGEFTEGGIGALLVNYCPDEDEPVATAEKTWFLPETTITDGPSGPTNDTTPTFEFTSDQPDATFECRVDGGAWVACDSPYTTGELSSAPHTFEVRASDAFNTDPTPAIRSFVVDATPPETTITDGPTGPTTDTTPTFTFISSEPGTFECSVDGGEFEPCTSPFTTATLTNASHTFEVRAIDLAGNPDASPASRSFTVDTTPPQTTITDGPTSTTVDATPNFEFSSSEPGTFECRVDGGEFSPCTSPYTATTLSDGTHSFEVRAIDAAGTTDPSPAIRSFIVDATAPQTTITDGPTGTTADTTPQFVFSSNEPGAAFECRVNGGTFVACGSPFTTAPLADGSYTFEVRAIDAAGNVDGSPASRSFVVDAAGPTTSITSGPTGSISGATATFAFSSEPGSTFECRVDGGSFAPCTSPFTTGPLTEGAHTFEVRATDALGNVGPIASRSFTRDVTVPETTIVFPPDGASRPQPVFIFFAEPESTFECRVDGGAFEPCTSPYLTDDSLSDGPHTFDVRATDAAGNLGPVSSRSFVRDTTPPAAEIASGPTGTVENAQSTFAFSSNEPGATFECRVDDGDFEPCISPFTTPALPPGPHTFEVRARDAAGNASAPVSRSFTVVAPTVPPPPPPGAGTPPPPPPGGAGTTPPPPGGPPVDPVPGADRDNDGIPDTADKSDASVGPTLAQTVIARVLSGNVFVRRPPRSRPRSAARAAQSTPGTPRGYVPLKGAEVLPVGTIVHAERGRLALTSAASRLNGRTQTQRAEFYRGIFQIRQKRARLATTDIAVKSANYVKECGSAARAGKAAGAARAPSAFDVFAAQSKKRSKKVVSRLWGNGKGRFRTIGRHSAATVRGTIWLTEERCDGTLTRVTRGVVSVRDNRARRTVTVRAGRSYLARAIRATTRTRRP